uniref:type I protein arginine methyltransferase n=1 Tax=Plectus sambesii TaxID=2011161 RepID=A0A914WSX9_9BILA
MAHSFGEVQLLNLTEEQRSLGCSKQHENLVTVSITPDEQIVFTESTGAEVSRLPLEAVQGFALSSSSFAVRPKAADSDETASLVLKFTKPSDAAAFREAFKQRENGRCERKRLTGGESVFDQRTEEASASQYFQFYGYLSQQQNMMQDYVRTATYQRAMLANTVDFKDKVVMDVGAGSGILSFFAVQSGAKTVYAVEASSMAKHCESLVWSNNLADKIKVTAGKIEEVNIPEQVDMIISEPMGYMLFNERMLESFLHAKKFLKPGGRMFPSRGDLHLALFTDEALYLEQSSKASFWCQESFHGVNLSFLRPQAVKEYFKQPVVDTWHIATLLSQSHKWSVDFGTADEKDLHLIDIPFDLTITKPGVIHGIAFWFDVAFIGGSQTVWLSTAPTEPLTHWYQVRCLLERPLIARMGQNCTGRVIMKANDRQSYDVDIEVTADGITSRNSLDLKNPYFRYTGQAVQPPPGNIHESPTDAYWQTAYQDVVPPATNGSHVANGGNIMDLLANAHAAYRGGQGPMVSNAQSGKTGGQTGGQNPLFTQTNNFGGPMLSRGQQVDAVNPALNPTLNPALNPALTGYRPWTGQ